MLPYVLLLLFLVVSGFLLCERNPSRRKDAIYLGIRFLGVDSLCCIPRGDGWH